MSFTFADLFAGIGGFHAALRQHGGHGVFVSEIDLMARKVYELNWEKTKKFVSIPDVRVAASVAKAGIPDHQVLTAGFPCQPFSKSGKQVGVKEPRGTLFHDILEIARVKKPEIILLENVRNLIGPRHHSDYLKMVRLLREAGYAVSSSPTLISPHEIPERNGGSPQHRQRLFIACYHVGKTKASKLIDLPSILDYANSNRTTSVDWDVKTFLKKHVGKIDPKQVISLSSSQLAALEAWEEFVKLNQKSNRGNPLPGMPLWSEFWKTRIRIKSDVPDWKRAFIKRNHEFYLNNQLWIDKWKQKHAIEDFIPSFRKFEWQARELESIWQCLIQFRPSGIRVKVPNYVPTFVAMAQTPYLGWEQRALTVREAAVLQGFPTDFDFGTQPLSLTMKQIGNAVHPGVVGHVFTNVRMQAESLGIFLD